MRKFLGLAMVLTTMISTAAMAQLGSRDGTTGVMSGRIGSPGGPSDAITEYQNRRAMNNLPTTADGRALASKLGPARPAKASELSAGATVNDNTGTAMATIAEVDPDGVVVALGTAKVKVPAQAFGRNKAGLLLDMTRSQFQQLVAKANGS